MGLDAVYVPFEVKPEDLKTALEGLKALGIKGVNITIPHKENVLEFVDHADEHAKNIGSGKYGQARRKNRRLQHRLDWFFKKP